MATKRETEAKVTAWLKRPAADYFQLLEVHKGMTPDEVSARRKELAKMLHPDHWAVTKNEALAQRAISAMADVNAAHAVLTTKDRRLRYLAELATGRRPCAACKGEGYNKTQRGFKAVEKSACTVCGGSGLLGKVK